MLRAEVLGWCLLYWAPIVSCDVINPLDLKVLEKEFGAQLTGEWHECGKQTRRCPVARFAEEMSRAFDPLRIRFDACTTCVHEPQLCKDFFEVMTSKLDGFQHLCIHTENDFPPACSQTVTNTKDFVESDKFQMYVFCSVILPGVNFSRVPSCSRVAKAVVAREHTLSSCRSMSRTQCVQHMCRLNTRFRWWMRPYNVQEDYIEERYPYSYILEGCADLTLDENYWDPQECEGRLDIAGMCECICGGMAIDAIAGDETCEFEIDAYLLWSRQGVKGLDLTPRCEAPLCSLFDSQRGRCPYLHLPDMKECKAYQLPYIQMPPCPWVAPLSGNRSSDTGEDDILECLDGHRCNVNIDSWSCCALSHRGRAKCPANLPVMCDYLSSGIDTEYACQQRGRCNQRKCSSLLLPYSLTFPPTTTVETTTPFFPEGALRKDKGFEIHIPDGSWVFLILIAFCLVWCVILVLWYRARKNAELVVHVTPSAKIDEERDRIGGWTVVRKPEKDPDESPDKLKVTVKVVVDELPNEKPLGLEMQETKVVRVLPYGARWGWQEGDVIVEIGNYPVSTFEELWQRIQVERDRVPCIFMVEREMHKEINREHVGLDKGIRPEPPSLLQAGSRHISKLSGSGSRTSAIRHARTESMSGFSSRVTSKIDGPSRMTSKLEGASRVSSKLERDSVSRGSGPRDAAGVNFDDPMAPELVFEESDDGGPTLAHWWTEYDERAGTPSDHLPSAVPNWRTMYYDEPPPPDTPRLKKKPYTGPKFEDTFEELEPIDIVQAWAKKNAEKSKVDPKSEVRFATDSWGRSVLRMKD